MNLHPAFWPASQDANGVVSGLWQGKTISFNTKGVPAEIRLDADGAEVIPREAVVASLRASRANVDSVLHSELSNVSDVGAAAFVELAHIVLGLPRHAALAASDAPDRPTAEALTKLSIHWTRNAEHWRELVRLAVGSDSSDLLPLPTTTALQLALEELASRDLTAYLMVVSAFGLPGDEARVTRFAQAAQRLLSGDPSLQTEAEAVLRKWASKAVSLEDNYASVTSLRAMGSLADTDFFDLAVGLTVPADLRRWVRTTGAIRDAADTLSFFGFGVSHFYRDAATTEPFPRRKTAWAGLT